MAHYNITSHWDINHNVFSVIVLRWEKVGGWQSQERWMSTRNQRRDFPTQVPSTQPLTQPLPQHAKEHPVITPTTVVLNLDTVPRSTPTFPVCVCLLQLVFDISAFQFAWTSLGCPPFLNVHHSARNISTSKIDRKCWLGTAKLTHLCLKALNDHWGLY